MRSADSIELLRAELKQDLQFIQINCAKNRDMTERITVAAESSAPSEFEYAALGYTLHNLYSAMESYFVRIARFFENRIDQTSWHRSVIERMTLDIEGFRPALFDLQKLVPKLLLRSGGSVPHRYATRCRGSSPGPSATERARSSPPTSLTAGGFS